MLQFGFTASSALSDPTEHSSVCAQHNDVLARPEIVSVLSSAGSLRHTHTVQCMLQSTSVFIQAQHSSTASHIRSALMSITSFLVYLLTRLIH